MSAMLGRYAASHLSASAPRTDEVRFGALPEAIRAVLQDTSDEAQLRAWLRLVCTGDAAEIAAAIQAGPVG